MDNPYLQLTGELNRGRLRALISSGQAVVMHRLAIMTRLKQLLIGSSALAMFYGRTSAAWHQDHSAVWLSWVHGVGGVS
jgi:cytochrome b subunit of formate dehydrogenase